LTDYVFTTWRSKRWHAGARYTLSHKQFSTAFYIFCANVFYGRMYDISELLISCLCNSNNVGIVSIELTNSLTHLSSCFNK
jgi:hypothetical protein